MPDIQPNSKAVIIKSVLCLKDRHRSMEQSLKLGRHICEFNIGRGGLTKHEERESYLISTVNIID